MNRFIEKSFHLINAPLLFLEQTIIVNISLLYSKGLNLLYQRAVELYFCYLSLMQQAITISKVHINAIQKKLWKSEITAEPKKKKITP